MCLCVPRVYVGKLPLAFDDIFYFDDREKSRFLKRIDGFSTWTASSLCNGLEAFVRNIVAQKLLWLRQFGLPP